MRRSAVSQVAVAVTVLVALSMIGGQVIGHPILFGYVTSGSMSPTLESGDGYVAIPSALTDSPSVGDVVVYEASRVDGGGLTTHRVVGVTEAGYVTLGDANPVTDQAGGEPAVTDGQIVAEVMRFDGGVVVIPYLGVIVEGIQSVLRTASALLASAIGLNRSISFQEVAYGFFLMTVMWYVATASRADTTRSSSRTLKRPRGVTTSTLLTGFALVLVLGATAAMVVPAGSTQYDLVSARFDSERTEVIERGTSEERQYRVSNAGWVPVVVYLEPGSSGIDAHPDSTTVDARGAVLVTLRLSAPRETGYYHRSIVEHRYLAVLPRPVLDELYAVHPWVPIVVIDALLGVSFYGCAIVVLGRRRFKKRTRKGPSLLSRFG